MIKNYKLKYGKEHIDFPIDSSIVTATLQGKETHAICDIKAEVENSLNNPIGLPPLCEWLGNGDKVAIIISDMTRFWMRQDLVIPHVVQYLNDTCNIPYSDMIIVVSTGTHEAGTDEDTKTLVTEDVARKVEVIYHDCNDTDLTYICTTSRGTVLSINKEVAARKVVAIGACTQHVMAGFGGGRKSILPGVASMEAIKQNHAHSLDPLKEQSNPLIGNAKLENNPLHLDMMEAAAAISHLFTINLVMNPDMVLSHIFSGHYEEAWICGCKQAQSCYEVSIDEEADIIIASCGGFPKDISLYQGSKSIDNLESGLKLGGTLILVTKCPDGGGPPDYFDWLKPLEEGVLDKTLRENFTIPGYIFYLNCEQAKRYRIILLSTLNPEDAKAMGIEVYTDVDSILKTVDFKDKSVFVVPNASTVIPKVRDN